MWPYTTPSYRPVGQRDGEDDQFVQKAQTKRTRNLITMIVASTSFMLGMGVSNALINGHPTELPHDLAWTSNLRPLTTWTKFQGRLMAETPYRGTPNPSIDAAWARYTRNPWFDGGAAVLGVSKDDIKRSRKHTDNDWFNSTVRLDDENGGGYMATLEVFHQLHCLDMLRRYSYSDYYPVESFNSGSRLREHLDHCIDMIRQVLMCYADTGLVLFHWVDGTDAAVPDFSTWHKCRDPEEILQWAHDHEAPITRRIAKPTNEVGMPAQYID